VVDDEEVIRETAAAQLRHLGYDVITAEDGEEGVELYKAHQNQIFAVILDMVMPRMNGKDCFMALRKINPQARVFIWSGFTRNEAMAPLRGKGLTGFIRKPCSQTRLAEALQSIR
jgi:CheY-like chemotaxis protein